MARAVGSSESSSRPPHRRPPSSGWSRNLAAVDRNLVVRVASAAAGIPIVVVLNSVGGIPFAVGIGLVALIAEVELIRLLKSAGYAPLLPVCVPAAISLAIVPMFISRPQVVWVGTLVLVMLLVGAYYLTPQAYSDGMINWILSVFSIVYIGLLLGHLTLLRQIGHGAAWVLLVLLMTWAYDTGAFFSGSRFGRRGFMRHVSPSKTLEGVAGGLLFSTLIGLVGIATIHLSAWHALVLGLVAGVVAQTGDLIESMIKRQTGAKDSGGILPGHGGLLDRIDSLLFTGVLGFYAAALLGYAP